MIILFKKERERQFGVKAWDVEPSHGTVLDATCLLFNYFGKDRVSTRKSYIQCDFKWTAQSVIRNLNSQKLQRLQEEHLDLCRAYNVEFVLKTQLNSHNERTSFEDGWNPLQGRINTIKDFCWGLASAFPSTSTVESENIYRTEFTDLSLEGILHIKQFY